MPSSLHNAIKMVLKKARVGANESLSKLYVGRLIGVNAPSFNQVIYQQEVIA